MASSGLILIGIAVLGAGTYLMRFGGAMLGSKLALSARSQALLADAATTLLFAVALSTALYEGGHFAGAARVSGVAVALFLAWRKMPLIVVIVTAAVVTALLRLAGIH
ncbi:AzlD domain-containing protein [Shimwellia pseudoproteus]|uniref:AzlD domain-containing protein n=1 Tax=Shimwellia pseudoproteus TaxID=570012 RepID=UPI0018EE0604|nr:AzlD domain-containing protein [Shimwellia pseudoproteus]MBJ3814347.1 AzlD domain-containing protein [Shimwellia pseudoproteus]